MVENTWHTATIISSYSKCVVGGGGVVGSRNPFESRGTLQDYGIDIGALVASDKKNHIYSERLIDDSIIPTLSWLQHNEHPLL